MTLDSWNRYKSEVHQPPLTPQERSYHMTMDTLKIRSVSGFE